MGNGISDHFVTEEARGWPKHLLGEGHLQSKFPYSLWKLNGAEGVAEPKMDRPGPLWPLWMATFARNAKAYKIFCYFTAERYQIL